MFSTAGTIPFPLKTFTAFISEHMLLALHLEDDSTAHQVLALARFKASLQPIFELKEGRIRGGQRKETRQQASDAMSLHALASASFHPLPVSGTKSS